MDDVDGQAPMDDEHPIARRVGAGPPAVSMGTVRAAEIDTYYASESSLARASLLPTVLLNAPPKISAVLGLKPTRSGRHRQLDAARAGAAVLSRFGFALMDGDLPSNLTVAAADEAAALELSPGGFVRGGQRLPPADASVRTDLVCTLRASLRGASALAAIDGHLEQFGRDLLEQLEAAAEDPEEGVGPLGTGPLGEILRYSSRSDMQIACYPGRGSHYLPHLDNGDGDGRHGRDYGRVLTLIYYLHDMAPEDGGALRLHLPSKVVCAEPAVASAVGHNHLQSHSAAVDVIPRAGLLVVFRADRIVHEVRPCARARTAATVWILAKAAEARAE
jgi:hypothetical protein